MATTASVRLRLSPRPRLRLIPTTMLAMEAMVATGAMATTASVRLRLSLRPRLILTTMEAMVDMAMDVAMEAMVATGAMVMGAMDVAMEAMEAMAMDVIMVKCDCKKQAGFI